MHKIQCPHCEFAAEKDSEGKAKQALTMHLNWKHNPKVRARMKSGLEKVHSLKRSKRNGSFEENLPILSQIVRPSNSNHSNHSKHHHFATCPRCNLQLDKLAELMDLANTVSETELAALVTALRANPKAFDLAARVVSAQVNQE